MTSLHAIYRMDIANKLPVGGEMSFDELAGRCNLSSGDLRRIIRYAIAHHRVFQEPRKGIIAHSAASKKLSENPRLCNAMGVAWDECWPAYAKV